MRQILAIGLGFPFILGAAWFGQCAGWANVGKTLAGEVLMFIGYLIVWHRN